jgi:hypothetical protein
MKKSFRQDGQHGEMTAVGPGGSNGFTPPRSCFDREVDKG